MSGIAPMVNVPEGVQYGRVQAHLVAFIADTHDGDVVPDEVPLTGVVVLTPTVSAVRFPTTVPPRTAVVQALRCPVIGGDLYPPGTPLEGPLPDTPGVVVVASDQPAGLPGTVQWTATFRLAGTRVRPSPVTFNVPANGVVDLATVLPSTPAPGTVVVVSTEDRERAEAAAFRAEQIVADLEKWEPDEGPPPSWTEITEKPPVIAAGESVVEARAVIGAVAVEDLPDVSGLATKSALSEGLAGKQPVGDYALVSQLPDVSGLATTAALTSGLATKQAAGDYATRAELPDVSGLATKTALTEGLAGKQPVGDYATTTALTSGLAGKQPVGDYATRAELPDVSGLATTAYVDQMVGDIDTALSGILGGE